MSSDKPKRLYTALAIWAGLVLMLGLIDFTSTSEGVKFNIFISSAISVFIMVMCRYFLVSNPNNAPVFATAAISCFFAATITITGLFVSMASFLLFWAGLLQAAVYIVMAIVYGISSLSNKGKE